MVSTAPGARFSEVESLHLNFYRIRTAVSKSSLLRHMQGCPGRFGRLRYLSPPPSTRLLRRDMGEVPEGRRGTGSVEAPAHIGVNQGGIDCREHFIGMLQHVDIPEAKHTISLP